MSTMTSPHVNGRKRPSLSEQINRLDCILDGLSDALNDAVADAVKSAVGIAVKEAVEAVVKEVLANQAILAKLRPLPVAMVAEAAPAPAPAPITLSQRLSNCRQRVSSYAAKVGAKCQQAILRLRTNTGELWQQAIGLPIALWNHRELLWHFKGQILAAIAIGLLMAVLTRYAEPWISTVISGVGGFMTTLAVQAGLWLRSLRSDSAEEMA
jgi:hypothetical protein